MAPAERLDATCNRIRRVDPEWIRRALEHQKQLTKPEGSLGRIEEIANRISAIQETLAPSVDNPRILLFAADHGVADEGVSAFPRSVTAEMVGNFLAGGAAINQFAEANRIGLEIIDVGLREPVRGKDLVRRRVGAGTRNLARERAMSPDQVVQAVAVGIERAESAIADGCRVIGIGEMGIGNTTAAAAVTVALTGRPASEVVGLGTGIDAETMLRKVQAVRRAATIHRLPENDALEILSRVGGFEIAAMCGVCLGAARNRTAVVVDGFISAAAAALALRRSPAVGDFLIASHRSTEPGHAIILDRMGLVPLLDLGMRLGEGTGAALAIGILRSGVAAFTGMQTFARASVSARLRDA